MCYWFDSNESPWLWPHPIRLTDSERSIRRLRVYATRMLRQKKVAEQGWIRTLSQAAAWPIISIVKVGLDTREAQLRKGFSNSKPSLRVFVNKWIMLIWHHFRLSDQTDNCLEISANRQRIRSFIPCRELQVINSHTHQHGQGWPHIANKISFARFCRTHQLPTPETVAASDHTIVTLPDWPHRDLFLKAANLGKGAGMEVLHYQPSTGTWQTKSGDMITPMNLAAYAQKVYLGRPWLLQPRMRNGHDWRKFTNSALCTARIVTGLRPNDRKPIFISGFVRFPLKGAAVDNISAGGIGAGLIGAEGIMTPGFIWLGKTGIYPLHPETAARIEGETLPHWPELMELALKAHLIAGGWNTVGWDVTYSADGPMLIEANLNWAPPFHEPLTETPFISILQSIYGPMFEGLPKAAVHPSHGNINRHESATLPSD